MKTKIELRKGSGAPDCGGSMEERVEQVKSIFSQAGVREWYRALTFQATFPQRDKGEKIIAELDEDEKLFSDLMHYVEKTEGERGNVDAMMGLALSESFWVTVRSRYGYTDHGDLGLREWEGKVVLVESPEVKQEIPMERLDVTTLMRMARAMGRA